VTADGFGTEFDEDEVEAEALAEVDRFGTSVDEQEEEGKINVTVKIPPRRRTATLDVKLTSGKKVVLALNKTGLRLTVPSPLSYYSTESIPFPRNLDDLCRLRDLIDAGIGELETQIAWAAEEAD